jgi:hypothetical protein
MTILLHSVLDGDFLAQLSALDEAGREQVQRELSSQGGGMPTVEILLAELRKLELLLTG